MEKNLVLANQRNRHQESTSKLLFTVENFVTAHAT